MGVSGSRRGVARARDTGLLAEACARAHALLVRNTTDAGILAATPGEAADARRYTRIFGRDAAICAIAMALSGDAVLRRGAGASLRALAAHQADNGQIPKYVDPAGREGDFWYLGCIDATLWWLIALRLVATRGGELSLEHELGGQAARAIQWLRAQEHPRLHLVQQNEASDWADVMPRSGFVLYSNALWYYVKRLYSVPATDETHYHFNHLFHPFSRDLPEYHRLRLLMHYARHHARDQELYLSFVNFSFFGEEGDVLGNLLAIVFGLADDAQSNRIIHTLTQLRADKPWPMRAVCRPIRRRSRLWRLYMERHRQNVEYQYHNGGIWPFIGGFWVMALASLGLRAAASDALDELVAVNQLNNWAFNEWLHGKTGKPMGMSGQSWNAAMLLLANHALQEKVF
jgi:glycogen debranching enzyme